MPGIAPANDQIAPGYVVRTHLHRSNQTDVYVVHSEERDCPCIVKRCRPELRGSEGALVRRRLRREAMLLASLTHPNIVRLYDVLLDDEPMLVLEHVLGVTLSAALRGAGNQPLPPSDLVLLGRQVSAGIGYLHRRGQLHLDIKGANVMVGNGKVTILDLGLARAPGRAETGIGTDSYMSPEQARGHRLTAATDAWGIGAILFKAATAARPFEQHERAGRRRAQVAVRAPRLADLRPDLPPSIADAVDRCLDPMPEERPTLRELVDVFDQVELVA